MITRRALLATAPVTGLAWLLPRAALAHPNHVTLSTVEFNRQSGKLEVSVHVDPDDLERAIRKATRTTIRPEDPKAEAHVQTYVRERFVVRPPAGKSNRPRPLHWVGMEVHVDAAWLYFEIPVRGIWGLRLTNTLFFDLEDGQVNTVNLRDGENRLTLVTSHDRPVVTVNR